jgi:hypothetical protein
MTDPVFLIATTGLSVSAIVTAIRLINWFLHSDPKAIAQTGRVTAAGLFVLSLPLLLGLALNQRWAEAIGLSAVLLLALAPCCGLESGRLALRDVAGRRRRRSRYRSG